MWYEWEDKFINLDQVTHIIYEKIRFVNHKEGLEVVFHFGSHELMIRFTESEYEREFNKIRDMIKLSKPEHISRCC